MQHQRLAITSTSGGVVADQHTRPVDGWFAAAYLELGTLASGAVDITITDDETGATVLTITDASASGFYYPTKPIPATGTLKVAVAQAGNSHTGYVTTYVSPGSGAISELDATSTATLATSAKQDTTNTEIGGTSETAAAADTTASVGLNGRLQRIAQRLTSLIALVPAALGTNGGLKTESSLGQPSLATDFGVNTKANAKASAGTVRSVAASNANASVRYLQLHNKASAPAGTDVPLYSIALPAGSASQPTLIVLDEGFFTRDGKAFATGIGWAISTTRATFTDAATASEHAIHLHYA